VRDTRLRDRRGETLFVDARKLGTMETRTLRVLTDEHIAKVADAYHTWREPGRLYADEPGFCKSVKTAEILAQGYVLTPGRYVGTATFEEDNEPFEQRMVSLIDTLREQMTEGARLDERIRQALAEVGHGW
jgi:type I restriction enzyme M protein